MRVIAGTWKGRILKSPSGDDVRPTTDRVKEALFNILGPGNGDGIFLDLCCGAGGLGIEALSRGYGAVVFVDLSSKSLDLARRNLEICGADFDRVRLVKAEAASWLAAWQAPSAGSPRVLVADPPYQSGAAGAIMRAVDGMLAASVFDIAVVEHGARTPDLPGPDDIGQNWTTRKYGESRLALARAPRPGDGD